MIVLCFYVIPICSHASAEDHMFNFAYFANFEQKNNHFKEQRVLDLHKLHFLVNTILYKKKLNILNTRSTSKMNKCVIIHLKINSKYYNSTNMKSIFFYICIKKCRRKSDHTELKTFSQGESKIYFKQPIYHIYDRSLTQPPLLDGHEIFKFAKPILGHHYFILSLSDLE